ncbi:MAG: DNA-directed RNA polymerase subunit beta, partial [Clostridia bacterium]|nr:DNA-directed RNA polymerase subunit beta [Clostridia bacterium]
MVNVKKVQLGRNTRMSFSKIDEVLQMPNLIEIQKNSYQWFLDKGLREVFADVSGITDHTGNLVLDFVDYRIDEKPKYSVEECKVRDATYSASLRVTARLHNKETGTINDSEVYMGEFPLMTDSGTFIINGAERVIVSQLVRSPGVYYKMDYDKSGKHLFTSTVIPNRGAWLEYETDANDVFYVRIDKNRKLPVTTFARALGLSSDTELFDFFGRGEVMEATIGKDPSKNSEEAMLEVFKKLRPGEPPALESARSHINGLFFDARRYDISRVGRYKYNKKLSLTGRILGRTISQPVVDSFTGEIICDAGTVVSTELAAAIEKGGVGAVYVSLEDGREVRIVSNSMVDASHYIDTDILEKARIEEKVRVSVLLEVLDKDLEGDELVEELLARHDDLIPKHIIIDDIFASINYLICLTYDIGTTDDIDHLGNRRIRSVGELLQNQFRIGFTRLERGVREKMGINDAEIVTAQTLINSRPVAAAIREFFGSSPLSQFMDQTNPLAELTHKRRLSALGPGGLSRDRAGFEVRDVHY